MNDDYMPKVIQARVLQPYIIEVTFSDGTTRRIDLQSQLWGEVFEPLRDPAFFAQVTVDEDTIVWPNGADLAPEWLYQAGERVQSAA